MIRLEMYPYLVVVLPVIRNVIREQRVESREQREESRD
jgi:hypothetical protein